jgi:hypothetical protein
MTEAGFGLCGERLVLLDALSDASVNYSRVANDLVDLAGTSRRQEFEHTTRMLEVARSAHEASLTALRDHEVAHGCGPYAGRGEHAAMRMPGSPSRIMPISPGAAAVVTS